MKKKNTKGFDIAIISLIGLVLLISTTWIGGVSKEMNWIITSLTPAIVFGTIIAILVYLKKHQ